MTESARHTVSIDDPRDIRRVRQARLIVVEGPELGSAVTVAKHTTYVGRGPMNDVDLSDSKVSTRHAEIEVTDEGYLLRDLGSTNGTFFAGARVREVYLTPGMAFRVGATQISLESTDSIVEIQVGRRAKFGEMAGVSPAMSEIFNLLERVSPTELTVLVTGETGTGKERLARSIHKLSKRSRGPYVVLDCSSIPKELAESTVFGHERGAFTGAAGMHRGAFEQADGGTIFLDEVGELDLSLQPKLLRVLENREVRRVGGDQVAYVDVRVVAATNRDLKQMVSEGSFREDLYFRLSVIQCELPALRERREDMKILVDELLAGFAGRRPDLEPFVVAPETYAMLSEHAWPGNVRELKNVIERSISLCERSRLMPEDIELGERRRMVPGRASNALRAPGFDVATELPFKEAKQKVVERFETIYLAALAERFGGNLSRASREVGLTRYHLRELLRRHGLLERFRGDGA